MKVYLANVPLNCEKEPTFLPLLGDMMLLQCQQFTITNMDLLDYDDFEAVIETDEGEQSHYHAEVINWQVNVARGRQSATIEFAEFVCKPLPEK